MKLAEFVARGMQKRIVPGTDLSGKRDTGAKSFHGEFMANNGIKKQSILHSFQVPSRGGREEALDLSRANLF